MILDYIECEHLNFPESTAMSEGIIIVEKQEEQPSLRILCDEVYRTVDGKDLHLQVILPTQEKKIDTRFPLIVYVQGSGWRKQCRGKEMAQLCRFAQRGYVVAIVEYRHSGWATFPAQVIDTKYAIDYMVSNADNYFIDPKNIFLWGDSSGGHSALLAGFTQNQPFFLEDGLKEHAINGIIAYYPAVDIRVMNTEPSTLNHFSETSPEGELLGGVAVNNENAYKTVVTNYIDENEAIPPVLLFHGSMDRTVPFAQTVLLYDKLKECQKDVTCYQIKGADHGGAPFWTKSILDIVDSFAMHNFQR